jgi:hypothetical protein
MTDTFGKTTHPDEGSSPRSGATPTGSAGEELRGEIKQDFQRTKQSVGEEARKVRDDLQEKVQAEAEAATGQRAEEVDKLAHALDSTASTLREEDLQGLASYATDLSEQLSKFAGHLRERSPEQLAADARSLARDNPTAFLIGSVALGLGLSRFFKASSPRAAYSSPEAPPGTTGTTTDRRTP